MPELNAQQVHELVVAATPGIDQEWVDEGVEAWHNRPDGWGEMLPLDDVVRVILAGALPLIVEAIAQRIEAVDPVEWALAGQRAGQDAAQIVRDAFKPEVRNAL